MSWIRVAGNGVMAPLPIKMITARIDAVTKIPANYQAAVLPAPKSVKIEISPRCNYRCGFCALTTREKQPKWDMDFDLFKRITREMREAGVEEIGAINRGENMQITSYLERAVTSELSGNVVDLCPVGALTAKPYAFEARPWELTKVSGIDVMDAMGTNVRFAVGRCSASCRASTKM